MMHNNTSRITAIVKILRQATKTLKTPSVTMVGKKCGSPFLVLISCLLSLRTKDEVTLKASQQLFGLATTPREMLALSVATIEKTIYPVGFYKTKARRIKGICRSLLAEFGGRVPDTIDELLTLKGVGRKTANLVMTEGYGKAGVCVDTHVHRISNRIGLVKTKSPEQTEKSLMQLLPKDKWLDINEVFVKHGQQVCLPIKPRCQICPVSRYCNYYKTVFKPSVTSKANK